MVGKFLAGILSVLMLGSVADASTGKKVLMIIASHNFRDEEFLKPKGIFEKQGFRVTIASTTLNMATGMLGAKVKPDILLKDVNVAMYDVIVFVGGSGATEYIFDPTAQKIAGDAYKQGKLVAAICLGPRVLAEAGLLKGKRATVFGSEVEAIKSKGAIYTGKDVEIDGRIITASGPKAAEEFGKAIVSLLK